MTTLRLPYGASAQEATLTFGRVLATLDIGEAPALALPHTAALDAFAAPIGAPPLRTIVRPGERVVIVVSDSFRKTEIHQVLPALLDTLLDAGVNAQDLHFLYATGTHRGPTPEEERAILGPEIADAFRGRTITHDPFNEAGLVHLGDTARGTPVWINRQAVEADRLIVTGTVVLHYFGGFGGGRKAVLPGIAGVESIAHNHALNLHPALPQLNPAVRIGAMEGNPVAEDMLEGARMVKVDFLVNTVLNRAGKIAGLFCGAMEAAHLAACELARELYALPIDTRADLVVASAGAARNFLQSHKALFNAYQAMRPSGRLIFLAEAPEGFGGNKFEKWLALKTPEAVIAELRKNAEINGQTALSTLEKAPHTILVSALGAPGAALIGAQHAATLQEALALAQADLAAAGVDEPSVYLMPSASYSVPMPR